MRIESVIFKDFAPFADTQLTFPEPKAPGGDVHLFAGENGTGKTRMLTLLAAVCGNPGELKERTDQSSRFKAAVSARMLDLTKLFRCIDSNPQVFYFTGQLELTEGYLDGPFRGKLDKNGRVIEPSFDAGANMWQKGISACLAFRGMATVKDSNVEALKPVQLGNREVHLVFEHNRTDEDAIIGQSMTNIKMQAAMEPQNGASEKKKYTRMATRIEEAVSRVTGRSFSFAVTPYPQVSLVVDWGGVTMRLKLLPDGLRSIIGWMVACAAKIDAFYPDHPDPLTIPTILLLDEPESHLHPAWQRKIIPAAQALLPNCQIFAATHSPFLISSVNAGYIHVFRSGADGVVTIDPPRECSPGDTYLDVVEDILGVKEWYDPETERELGDFRVMMDQAVAGQWEHEPALREKARRIAERSESLNEMMGREMHQFETLKAQAQATR